jgi:hypothetical protein
MAKRIVLEPALAGLANRRTGNQRIADTSMPSTAGNQQEP